MLDMVSPDSFKHAIEKLKPPYKRRGEKYSGVRLRKLITIVLR